MIKGNKDHYFSLKSICDQQKLLVTIVQEINSLKTNNTNSCLLISSLIKLDDFIMERFMYEEKIMVKYCYSGMELHKQQHNYLRGKLEAFNLYDLARPNVDYEEALEFIFDMLSIHMIKQDIELTRHISQKIIQTQIK